MSYVPIYYFIKHDGESKGENVGKEEIWNEELKNYEKDRQSWNFSKRIWERLSFKLVYDFSILQNQNITLLSLFFKTS